MARVIFYEKPGCVTNVRQRAMLEDAGHEVVVRNLLTERWTPLRLLSFFGQMPVSQWFNRASPRVKSGEIDPAALDGASAIALMLADPLLIRRPLIEVDDRWRCAGFDAELIDCSIGLKLGAPRDQPPKGCAHGDTAMTCPNLT